MICSPLVMVFDSCFHLSMTLQFVGALGVVTSCFMPAGLEESRISEDSVFSTGFEYLVV